MDIPNPITQLEKNYIAPNFYFNAVALVAEIKAPLTIHFSWSGIEKQLFFRNINPYIRE